MHTRRSPQKAATSMRGPQDTQRQKVACGHSFFRTAPAGRAGGARPPCVPRTQPVAWARARSRERARVVPHRAPAAWALRCGRCDSLPRNGGGVYSRLLRHAAAAARRRASRGAALRAGAAAAGGRGRGGARRVRGRGRGAAAAPRALRRLLHRRHGRAAAAGGGRRVRGAAFPASARQRVARFWRGRGERNRGPAAGAALRRRARARGRRGGRGAGAGGLGHKRVRAAHRGVSVAQTGAACHSAGSALARRLFALHLRAGARAGAHR